MAFKINVSLNGKTAKFETENEEIIGKLIGEDLEGSYISADLEDYKLKITGTSDKAGFPGLPDVQGPSLKKVLLKKGRGMWDNREGVRIRKTVRGNIISPDTVQINTTVLKEGKKKFEEFVKKPEAEEKKA
jgi:small subunit ribosomal protein S6e